MIIPKFRCYQDHKFVHVEIVLSALCKVAEAQFSIADELFTFTCSPYFMRLRFDAPLCEGQGESATYNVETNVLNVRLPKLNAGEVFKTLDFPNMLLATTLQQQRLLDQMERNAKAAALGNGEGGDAAQDEDEEDDEEDLEETEFDQHDQLTQQLQRLTVGSDTPAAAAAAPSATPNGANGIAASRSPVHEVFYGFNKSFSGVLAGLDADVVREFVSLPDPERTAPAVRTRLREAREDADFNEDQFVFSMVDEDGEIDAAMVYRPWYVRLYEQGLAQARSGAAATDSLIEPKLSSPAPPVGETVRPMLAPAHPGAIGASYVAPSAAAAGTPEDDDDDVVPNDALKGIADAAGTVTAWSGNVQPLADADQAAAAAAAAVEIIHSLQSEDHAAANPPPPADAAEAQASTDMSVAAGDAAAQIRTVRPTRSGLAVLCPAPHPTLSMSEAALLTQVPATPNPLLHRPAQSIAALVDILAATAYDIQTSEGQRTVESGWNIAMLSPALQWLDDARAHPADVAIAFCRRVAVYPLHRSFHLAMRCLRDVGVMLLQGPTVCVKVLLHAKAALDASERQHVLSTLWVNPMLSWLSAAAAMRDEPAQQLVAAMEDYADVLHTFLRTGQRRPFLASFLAAAEPSAFEELTASRRKVAVESLEPLNWRLLRLPLSNEMLQSPE